jgi:predicted nucleotide-binding protein
VKFSSRIIRKAIEGRTRIGNAEWTFDEIEEFLTSYGGTKVRSASFDSWWDKSSLHFSLFFFEDSTRVIVKNDSRASIESVFSLFEEATEEDKIYISADKKQDVTIFIGHGRKPQWEKLKLHLQDKHNLNIVCYESGARAGHAIRDILESMTEQASFAILVLTGEDKTADGLRARQNVIHECGLFQGKLGFDRAIMIVEDGVELASNFDGIQQLRFKKGQISTTFGDIIATVRREFGPI